MGYKKVCFGCRKAFSINKQDLQSVNLTCPECANVSAILDQKFRPPKQNNIGKWGLAKFLFDHGFIFQRVYKEIGKGVYLQISYPQNLQDAEEFVIANKSQAINQNLI